MKEQLVDQLKTQITDLERFIQYMHVEQTSMDKKKCACSKNKDAKQFTHSDIGHEEEASRNHWNIPQNEHRVEIITFP